MLVSLYVKNLALIDEISVEFGSGLNILTGETGAGKSIILGSVNLALGARADKDCIRTGAEQALIEMVFQLENEAQMKRMKELELPVEEDNLVILQRRITPQRSVCRVGGETVTAKQLKELSELLLNIHGQRDNQVLLQPHKQLEFLDAYAGETMQEQLHHLKEEFAKYRECLREQEGLEKEEADGQRELSLARFEVEEIERVAFLPGEDEELEKRYRKMQNSRRIMESLHKVHELTGYQNMQGAGSVIGEALHELKSAAALDEDADGLNEQLINIDALLNDFNRELSVYMEDAEFDEEQYRATEERLDELNRLKAKYGSSYEEVTAYLHKQQQYLEKMEDFDAYKTRVKAACEQAQSAFLARCEKVSGLRSKAAEELQKELAEVMSELNFLDARVRIDVDRQEHPGASGQDDVTFMVALNPGEPLKSLQSVASGGELSRIMLALKTIMADKDEIDAMIFDEIDAGISGRTAWTVSEKLGALSRNCQIICITHLPQIAAMADKHFVIEKRADENRTVTTIRPIEGNESRDELARMLGGGDLTDAAKENAAEMLQTAATVKSKKWKKADN